MRQGSSEQLHRCWQSRFCARLRAPPTGGNQQQSFKRSSARWRRLNPGGLISPEHAREMEMEGSATKDGIPAKLTQFESPGQLLLKNDWMRFSTKIPAVVREVCVEPETAVSAYDGVESRFLTVTANGKKQASIRRQPENPDARAVRIYPLLLFLRPFGPPFNRIRKERLRLVDGVHLINGRKCLLVDDGEKRLWLDPDRGYVAVAAESYRPDGKTTFRAEMEYVRHPQLSWVPTSFQVDVFDLSKQEPLRINLSHRASHVQIDVGPRLQQRDFTLVFDSGTDVFDQRDRMHYKIEPGGGKGASKPY